MLSVFERLVGFSSAPDEFGDSDVLDCDRFAPVGPLLNRAKRTRSKFIVTRFLTRTVARKAILIVSKVGYFASLFLWCEESCERSKRQAKVV